jgi:hypothetical protein
MLLVFGAKTLKTSPGMFVPALVFERQLSRLLRHCRDVPGYIALGQPTVLCHWMLFRGAPCKKDRERRTGPYFSRFHGCWPFRVSPKDRFVGAISALVWNHTGANQPLAAKVPVSKACGFAATPGASLLKRFGVGLRNAVHHN